MTNKKLYAITINNLELINNIKTIKKANEYLITFCDTIYTISVERNELNNNIHYHALVEASPLEAMPFDIGVWFKELQHEIDIIKYLEYIKKDGNYKIYNRHTAESSKITWQEKLLALVYQYDTPKDLLIDNPIYINRIYHVEKLFELIKKTP